MEVKNKKKWALDKSKVSASASRNLWVEAWRKSRVRVGVDGFGCILFMSIFPRLYGSLA
jgi:hypothetical protein